ncbi:MAG: RAD55 family ATPase, partial [Candidatus Rokuibacteriota bacterium]
FVDSLGSTLLPESNGGRDSRDAFHVLVEGLHREHLTAVFALEDNPRDTRASSGAEQFIADTIVRLTLDVNERAVARGLEVVKSRGHDFQMGRHSFRIADGRGLECFRRVQSATTSSARSGASWMGNEACRRSR